MNVIGALGWVSLGLILGVSGAIDIENSLSISALLLYALLFVVPAITAYALANRHIHHFNLIVQALNSLLLVYFVFNYLQIVLEEKTLIDWALFITLLLVVIPTSINIGCLRHLRKYI